MSTVNKRTMDRTLNVHALCNTNNYLEKGLSRTPNENDLCKDRILKVEPLGTITPSTVPSVTTLENKSFMFPLSVKNDVFKKMFMKNEILQNTFFNRMTPAMTPASINNKDLLSVNSKLQIRNVFSPNRKKTLIKTEEIKEKSNIKSSAKSKVKTNTKSKKVENIYKNKLTTLDNGNAVSHVVSNLNNNVNSNKTIIHDSTNNPIRYNQNSEIKFNQQINKINSINQMNKVVHNLHEDNNNSNSSIYNGTCNGNGKNFSDIEEQMNHEKMKHMFFERQFYSKYTDAKTGIENGERDLNKQNQNMPITEFDYSMKYMVWNERTKQKNDCLTERGPGPVSRPRIESSNVKYTIEDVRNFCLDNRKVININNINIIQCNNSSNSNSNFNSDIHAKNENVEHNKKWDRSGSYGSCASCTTYGGCKQCEETEEKKEFFQNGMNNLERNNRKGVQKEKECEYIHKNNKTFKHCNSIISNKENCLNHQGSTEFGNTQYATSVETLIEETGTALEKRTNNHIIAKEKNNTTIDTVNTVDYKINEMIEESKREIELQCSNNLSNQSLRKGKKKTMGACFLNLNYLTCQFLVSCDKV